MEIDVQSQPRHTRKESNFGLLLGISAALCFLASLPMLLGFAYSMGQFFKHLGDDKLTDSMNLAASCFFFAGFAGLFALGSLTLNKALT